MKEKEMPVRDYLYRVISIERLNVAVCTGSYASTGGEVGFERE